MNLVQPDIELSKRLRADKADIFMKKFIKIPSPARLGSQTHAQSPVARRARSEGLFQSLVISRDLSYNARKRSNERTRASMAHAIPKIPKNPADPAPNNPPNTRKHTQTLMISRKRSPSLVQRSYEATCVSRSSTILKIPKNPADPAPNNPPNTRKHTQTLMISRKRSPSLVQHSYERTCVSRSSPILKIPKYPANPAPDNPPNTRKHSQTLVISRKRSQSLVQRSYEPTCVSRSSPILRIPKILQILLQTIRPKHVNTRKRS